MTEQKPKIIKCISWIHQDTIWTFPKTKIRNKTQNASDTFTALNLKCPTCACLLTFCKCRSIEQYCKRGKTKISVRHPHTMCNRTKTKNHKVHFMDRTKQNLNFFKNKGPKQNTKCIPHIHSNQSKASNMCTPTYALQIPIDRTVL